jgi:hypothetical protein
MTAITSYKPAERKRLALERKLTTRPKARTRTTTTMTRRRMRRTRLARE